MVRPRRAWIYVLSIAALLVPAVGIAYLGAVSYRDERGAITAQDQRQRSAALRIAARINQAIDRALDAADRATTIESITGHGPAALPLARYWFWIDADHQLRAPRAAPETVELGGVLDRGASCAGGRLEDCVRELSTRQTRIAKLHAAQRAEAMGAWSDAKRQYSVLTVFDDTGPMAQLGQVRVLRKLGDPRAVEVMNELERRFADRSFEGVPVTLVVAMLRAETAGADALLDIADRVLAGSFAIDPGMRLGVLLRIRSQVAQELGAPQLRRRSALDARIAEIRMEARAAAGLLDDVPELVRSATAGWRGRASARQSGRTLVYRRRADGGVIGIAVDATMLEDAAGHDPQDDVAQHAQPLVLPAGSSPEPAFRVISQVPLGEALPHLLLAIVNPIAEPDPHDEIIRERSRRHVMYTSALAVALAIGLLLIVRGAARARELAQLKSDFVSTVSHELKTPLTSIRMFAEMLEQGVAQGDAAKMTRYHGVIIQESHRLGILIANLLDYAQIEKGTRRYSAHRHAIEQLARDAVATFETLRDPAFGAGNPIQLVVSPDAVNVDVDVDRDVVIQAVLNLLANASKYGGRQQPIEVLVGCDRGTGWIAVRDHGPGIPAVEQARIFREFYRTPDAYRSGVEGTGLGLALVKRHVEALGGSVDVGSVVGQGATFTIKLPRTAGAT